MIFQRDEIDTEGELDGEEPNDDLSRMRSEMLPSLQMKYPGNVPRGRRNQIKYKVSDILNKIFDHDLQDFDIF